jgi:ectoine hydroxylase-related dioxygenase (phytanoyl-CoA dioxygenase family)
MTWRPNGTGSRYAVAFIYTDAPPHLGCPGNTAAFTITIDGCEAEVAEGVAGVVDRRETADYNQACAIATTVVGGRPDALQRACRELKFRHGPRAWVVEGPPPQSAAIARILEDLHDHMARRTIVNPDLEQRIGQLGLTKQRDELDDAGFTVMADAISPAFADEIRDNLNERIDETSGFGSHGLNSTNDGSAGRLLERHPLYEQTVVHPWVNAMADHVVGRGCLLSTIMGFRKGAGDETHVVHVDYPLVQEPYPAYSLAVTTIWALDDFTPESGPTLVVPGSHRRNREPRAGEGDDELTPILMPKGSIAMWRGNTWHSSRVRTAPGLRTTLHQTYCRIYTRSIDGYMDIEPVILERNPPQLASLCGLDDVFEKATVTGPFTDGAAYARRYYLPQRGGHARRA